MDKNEMTLGFGFDCGNCKFWAPMHEDEFGTCRRHAPTMTEKATREISDFDLWPRSYIDWWCGEWAGQPT